MIKFKYLLTLALMGFATYVDIYIKIPYFSLLWSFLSLIFIIGNIVNRDKLSIKSASYLVPFVNLWIIITILDYQDMKVEKEVDLLHQHIKAQQGIINKDLLIEGHEVHVEKGIDDRIWIVAHLSRYKVLTIADGKKEITYD